MKPYSLVGSLCQKFAEKKALLLIQGSIFQIRYYNCHDDSLRQIKNTRQVDTKSKQNTNQVVKRCGHAVNLGQAEIFLFF